MERPNKKERFSHRKRRAEHKKAMAAQRSGETDSRGFRLDDLILLVVVLSLIAFFFLVIKEIAPVIQSIFEHRYETLTFTLTMPIQAIDEAEFPKEGDAMRLLEASDDGDCIVVKTALTEDGRSLLVTLKKENVHYREGIGYEIDDVRIAVGAHIDFYFGGKYSVSAQVVSFGDLNVDEQTTVAG